MRTATLVVLALLLATPAGADWIFADGFENGDDRYWTGPLETCELTNGDPAPLCPDSLDYESWSSYWSYWPDYRTWKVCSIDPATNDSCVMLGAVLP